jgi:hypothetical protein
MPIRAAGASFPETSSQILMETGLASKTFPNRKFALILIGEESLVVSDSDTLITASPVSQRTEDFVNSAHHT